MPYPDDFNSKAFDRHWGDEEETDGEMSYLEELAADEKRHEQRDAEEAKKATYGENYLDALNKSTVVAFSSGGGGCQVREWKGGAA